MKDLKAENIEKCILGDVEVISSEQFLQKNPTNKFKQLITRVYKYSITVYPGRGSISTMHGGRLEEGKPHFNIELSGDTLYTIDIETLEERHNTIIKEKKLKTMLKNDGRLIGDVALGYWNTANISDEDKIKIKDTLKKYH